jgi:protein ERP2
MKFLWVGVLLSIVSGVLASSKISVSVPPFAKECIYHSLLDETDSLLVSYQVLTGGSFELDFEIIAPSGKSVIEQKDEKFADFVLKTFGLGEYSFCFSNPHKDLKKVEFSIVLGSGQEEENTTGKKEDVIADHSLSEIDRNLNKIERIMNYLRAREWRNMSTVESTQSRVVYLSIAIIVLTVGVSVIQATAVQFLFSSREKSFV